MILAAANTTDESVTTDILDSATEVTAEATKEVNGFFQFIEDNIPNIVSFGIKVVLALVFFFIGGKVIKSFSLI